MAKGAPRGLWGPLGPVGLGVPFGLVGLVDPVIGQGGVSSYEKSPNWQTILGAWTKTILGSKSANSLSPLSQSYLPQT